jgi:hypothetical protein
LSLHVPVLRPGKPASAGSMGSLPRQHRWNRKNLAVPGAAAAARRGSASLEEQAPLPGAQAGPRPPAGLKRRVMRPQLQLPWADPMTRRPGNLHQLRQAGCGAQRLPQGLTGFRRLQEASQPI